MGRLKDHNPEKTKPRDEATEAGYQPISLLTFLLCIAASVGVLMTLLHMLSLLVR